MQVLDLDHQDRDEYIDYFVERRKDDFSQRGLRVAQEYSLVEHTVQLADRAAGPDRLFFDTEMADLRGAALAVRRFAASLMNDQTATDYMLENLKQELPMKPYERPCPAASINTVLLPAYGCMRNNRGPSTLASQRHQLHFVVCQVTKQPPGLFKLPRAPKTLPFASRPCFGLVNRATL